MRYVLFNHRTKANLFFESRQSMNRWIRSHFPLMSVRVMNNWTVIKYKDIDFDRSFEFYSCVSPAVQQSLIDYILLHLKI